jgi:hypothetical protein
MGERRKWSLKMYKKLNKNEQVQGLFVYVVPKSCMLTNKGRRWTIVAMRQMLLNSSRLENSIPFDMDRHDLTGFGFFAVDSCCSVVASVDFSQSALVSRWRWFSGVHQLRQSPTEVRVLAIQSFDHCMSPNTRRPPCRLENRCRIPNGHP